MSAAGRSDGYHDRLAHYASHPVHRWYLRNAYVAGHAQLVRTGADPLAVDAPRVLLCGTGSAETTATFVEFLRARSPRARLVVVDLAEEPLAASRERLGPDVATFVRADAFALPFDAGSFDLVETDFFLQYFDREAKQRLAAEWRRVLAPTGALMTRDYVVTRSGVAGALERRLDAFRVAIFARTLDRRTERTSRQELLDAMSAGGLRAEIGPVRVRLWPSELLLVKHITARPSPR